MRIRRLVRTMTTTMHTIKERIFGSSFGYAPLSTPGSANSSNNSTKGSGDGRYNTWKEGLCSDPASVRLHRLAALRNFALGHFPCLVCLLLAAYRVTLPSSAWLSCTSAAVAALVLLFCSLIYIAENFFVYAAKVPDRSRFYTELPQSKDFPVWRLVRLQAASAWGSQSQPLKGFLILQEDVAKRSKAPTILFVHGNAGNIGHRLPLAQILYNVCGANVFLLEYRGFGASSGCPSELGIYADAMCAFDYLSAGADGEIDGRNIFLFGRSLGGAVVIDLATRPSISSRLRGTIVENTFCSIASMGHSIGANLLGPLIKCCLPTCMLANRYDSLRKLKTRPLDESGGKFLFLSSQKDEVVPPQMMTRLASAWAAATNQSMGEETPPWIFDNPEKFLQHGQTGLVRFANGTHGSTWTCTGFNEVIQRFLLLHSITK